MPNIPETVEAFLGSVAIGSIWSSCSPDFGINGVVERFSQIKPKILFVTNEYFYNGTRINVLERIPDIVKRIPSIKHIVITNYPGEPEIKKIPKYKNIKTYSWKYILEQKKIDLKFPKFDFEHELAILYSSGRIGILTMGKNYPKSTLVNSSLIIEMPKKSSRVFYFNSFKANRVVNMR